MGKFLLKEETVDPPTPSANYRGMYAKDDGFYQIDDTGAVTMIGN